MTPEAASVISAGIGALAVISVGVLGWMGSRQHRHTRKQLAENTGATKEVLHQVKNDHGTNLRDDLDELAERVASLAISQRTVENGQARMASMLGTMGKGLRDVAAKQESHDAASLLIVDRLDKADRALAREIRAHHPRHPQD